MSHVLAGPISSPISLDCTVDVSRIKAVNDGVHGSIFAHWSIELARKDFKAGEFDHEDAATLPDVRYLVMTSFAHPWTIPGVASDEGFRLASMREFLAAADVMRTRAHIGVNELVCGGASFILGSNQVDLFRKVPVARRLVMPGSAGPELVLDMGWYYQFWGEGAFMLYATKP
jgi:hypothetical protein